MDPHHGHKVKRLHYAAAELARALVHANHELPADFPGDALRQIAGNLQALEEASTEAEHLVLVHARSTLRNARRMLQGDPGELEGSLERTLKDVVVEIDDLLDAMPPREIIPLNPQEGSGPIVRRSDLEGKVVALSRRLDAMEVAGRQSITQINQNGLINIGIGSIKSDLDALIKVAGEFKAEIFNKMIDLSWVTHFVEQVRALSDAVRKDAAAIMRSTSELANFVHGLQFVHRLGNSVVKGGRALVHTIMRRIQKLSQIGPRRDLPKEAAGSEWMVRLLGRRKDLWFLETGLHRPWSVTEKDGNFYLRSSRFEKLDDHVEVKRVADEFVAAVNLIAMVGFKDYQGVHTAEVVGVGPNGSRSIHVFPYSGVVTVGELQPPDLTRERSLLKKHPFLAKVLSYMREERNWAGYWKAAEALGDEIGGLKHIVTHGWATQDQYERFSRTVQHHRHHRFPAPRDPMTEGEARSLLFGWLQRCLDWRLTNGR